MHVNIDKQHSSALDADAGEFQLPHPYLPSPELFSEFTNGSSSPSTSVLFPQQRPRGDSATAMVGRPASAQALASPARRRKSSSQWSAVSAPGASAGPSLVLAGARPTSKAVQSRSTTFSLATTAETELGYLVLDGISEERGALRPGQYSEDTEDRPNERTPALSPEEACYFLEELVAHELESEAASLWRLTRLDNDDGNGSDRPSDDLDPYDVPILRYLIKHFLLTLPLVRDNSPAFWTSGILPLLQAIQRADLSSPVDVGASPETLGWAHRALARFVAAGLKLSSVEAEQSRWLPKTTREPNLVRPTSPTSIVTSPSSPSRTASPSRSPFSFTSLFRPSSSFKVSPPTPENAVKTQPSSTSATTPTARKSPAIAPKDPSRSPSPLSESQRTSTPSSTPAPPTSATMSPLAPLPAPLQDPSAPSGGLSRSASRATTVDRTSSSSFVSAVDAQPEPSLKAAKSLQSLRAPLDTPLADGFSVGPGWITGPGTAAPDELTQILGFGNSPQNSDGPYKVDHDIDDGHDEDDEGDRTMSASRPMSPGPPPNSPPPMIPDASSEARKSKFGLPSLLGSKKRRASTSPTLPRQEAPASRRIPTQPSVAAMAIPADVSESRPTSSARLMPTLVEKESVRWPIGTAVPFWRGVPCHKLKWGGFEADIVGVRSTLFSHLYVIRVRRPSRLDEYVVRSETQFVKYFRRLNALLPNAHLRRVPVSDPKDDQLVRPRSRSVNGISVSRSSSGQTLAQANATADGELEPGPRKPTPMPLDEKTLQKRRSTTSQFGRSLKAQSMVSDADGTVKGPRSLRSTASTIGPVVALKDMKKMPRHDPRRRALRGWLRDTLSIRTVGHLKETAAFLLLGSIVPKDSDVIDIMKREMIDDARRRARVAVAITAASRTQATLQGWATLKYECIEGDGFVALSHALRTTQRIDDLPPHLVQSIEWLRFSLAETLFDTLVNGEHSGLTFSKVKSLHAAFPYFLVKQAFKLGRSSLMAKVLQDILLSKPFGSKSLLQKILSIALDDDPTIMLNDASRYRGKIASQAITTKLDLFVQADPQKKALIREYAFENNLELVVCIASDSFAAFMKKKPTPLELAYTRDADVRLVLDMQRYLRLIARERDASLMRELLCDDAVAQALETLATPFVEGLQRVYKLGGAKAVEDFQRFADQLIFIVEALRSRIQEPQKSIRILARLVARHQQALWDFLRSIHRSETIIEEFLQWLWTTSVFVRRGLAQPVDLDAVFPRETEDKGFLLAELEDLVRYQKKKRAKEYQDACRRYAGDIDADDPIVVEGDGKGKSQVEPHREPGPKKPRVSEIPRCAKTFHEQVRKIFAV